MEHRFSFIKGGRVQSLDGLRAISILFVCFSHGLETRGVPRIGWVDAVSRNGVFGAIGVDMFFVISGFLITLLMFREHDRTGAISLRGFYFRRALRIVPAFLVYLSFVAILCAVGLARLHMGDWLAALTYTMNFMPNLNKRWLVSHVWSLSVEEHFYLVWPLSLSLLGRRRALWVLLIAVASAPFVRWLMWIYLRGVIDPDFATPARMDTIAIGCLLAYLVTAGTQGSLLERIAGRPLRLFGLGLCIVVISVFGLSRSGKYALLLNRTVMAGGMALMVLGAASAPRNCVGRILNSRPLVWLGLISYSLYLWQQPFLNPHSQHWWTAFPANLAIAVACATCSYCLVELPFLSLKNRRASAAHGSVEPPSLVPAAS